MHTCTQRAVFMVLVLFPVPCPVLFPVPFPFPVPFLVLFPVPVLVPQHCMYVPL
jgi:hypothetical protein